MIKGLNELALKRCKSSSSRETRLNESQTTAVPVANHKPFYSATLIRLGVLARLLEELIMKSAKGKRNLG